MMKRPFMSKDCLVMTTWPHVNQSLFAFWYGLRVTEEKDFEVAIGLDGKGRMVEMVAAKGDDGETVVFHAMTPPTKKTMLELGALRR